MRVPPFLTCLARVVRATPSDTRQNDEFIVWDYLVENADSEWEFVCHLYRMEMSIRECTKALPTPAICMSLYESIHEVASMTEMDRDEELFESQRLHRNLQAWDLIHGIFRAGRPRYPGATPEAEADIRSEIAEILLDLTSPRLWTPTEWKMWHDAAVLVTKNKPIVWDSEKATSSVAAAIYGMLMWQAICGIDTTTLRGGLGIEYIRQEIDRLKIQARRMKKLTAAGRITGEFLFEHWGWSDIEMFHSYSVSIESGLDELEKSLGQ